MKKIKTVKLLDIAGKQVESITDFTEGVLLVNNDGWKAATLDPKMTEETLMDAWEMLTFAILSLGIDTRKTAVPSFDALNEKFAHAKSQASPATWAKESAMNFKRNFLYDEVMEQEKLKPELRKYKELIDKMNDYYKKGLADKAPEIDPEKLVH